MAHEHLETILSAAQTQGGLAHGLPADAYTSEAFWQVECKTVLANTWTEDPVVKPVLRSASRSRNAAVRRSAQTVAR